MADRGMVGVRQEDDSVRAVYLHNAYPFVVSGLFSYDTFEKATALIKLGDLSRLASTLDECDAYARPGELHHRAPRRYPHDEDFVLGARQDNDAEFLYVFQFGGWYAHGIGRNIGWRALAQFQRRFP